jgi:K+-transporting ATPase ATPase A chain
LIVLMALLPAWIVVTFGEMIGNRRQGWVLYGVMGALMVMFLLLCVLPEQHGTPMLTGAGVENAATDDQPGGNMEGKEVRFGIASACPEKISRLSPLKTASSVVVPMRATGTSR